MAFPGRHRTGAVVFVMLVALLLVAAKKGKGGKPTHLGVPPSQVVSVSTFSVPNNNSGGHTFFYDRNGAAPFAVPEGFSFVVTDLFIIPADLDPTNIYAVVVGLDNGEQRNHFQMALNPQGLHVALSGGLVIASGTPTARNTTFSSTACDVKLLGYFVKGEALRGGESLFPVPE